MKDIYDIYDLEKISYLPIALGYWLVIFAILTGVFLFFLIKFYQEKKLRKWQSKAKNELKEIKDFSQLYQLIKKIILYKYGREQVANLAQEDLLKFLHSNDPQKFNWQKHQKHFIEIFAPKKTNDSKDFVEIKKAISKWI